MMAWYRYTHHEIHQCLAAFYFRGDSDPDEVSQQALFCPYYVTLEGVLGADWGIIVNPESPKFGHLVFQHDACGCPLTADGQAVRVVLKKP